MMTISIQCVHCQKRYNAPASMAGKKVKCKHCGKVFAIPADAASPDEAEAGLSAMGADAAQESHAPAPAASRSGSRVGGKLGHPSAGYASKMARSEGVAEIDLANEQRGFSLRPSVPHDIPGAAVVEQFAPPLMAVIGLGWLGWAAFQSAGDTGVGWAGAVRALAYVVLSLGLAFPLGYWAVRHAARKHRFMLPPSPGLRALACFSLAFALAFVLWLAGQSVAMLAVGTFLGLVVALGAVWFLFRLQPQETPATLGTAAGAFVGSVVIAYLVLFGVHTVFATALAKSGTNPFAKSPMGPFAWDLPRADATHKDKSRRAVASTTSMPASAPSSERGTVNTSSMHGAGAGADAGGTNATSRPSAAPSTQLAAVTPTGAGPQSDPDTTKGTTPEPSENSSPSPAAPATRPNKNPATAPVEPAVVASPIVSTVAPVDDAKGFSQVFASPTGAFGVMKKGAAEETVTFFAGNPPKKAAVQPEPFPVEGKVTQNYCLTNGGETMARLTTFPKVGVQLVSTATGQETRTIPLDETLGTPHVLGFGANDAVVVLWNNNGRKGIEVLNSKTGKRVTVFNLRDPFEQTASNPTISPDGRQLAVATVVDNKGAIDLYDLGPGLPARTPRSLIVQLAQWETPLGMCYSPDGKHISAYFEVQGNGVLFHFQTGVAKEPVSMHVFRGARALSPHAATAAADAEAAAQAGVPVRRSAPGANATDGFTGRALEFVSPNEWLAFGRHVIDVETGRPVGELGVANAKAQRVLDKETVLVQTADAAGNAELLHVKLNAEQIAAKRGELRGTKAGLNK